MTAEEIAAALALEEAEVFRALEEADLAEPRDEDEDRYRNRGSDWL